jgi:hypothetical protein
MRLMKSVFLAAMLAASGWAGAAHAEEGVAIDCKQTDLNFEAPGFKVDCKDYSRSSVSVGEMNAATKAYTLFAMSEAELTFLHIFSNHVLGGTRLYFDKRSLSAEIEDHFNAKFSDWADADEIGDYEVKRVNVAFKSGDPMECVAFRQYGARRQEGVSGMTVGFACSASGRDKAVDALKRFAGEAK